MRIVCTVTILLGLLMTGCSTASRRMAASDTPPSSSRATLSDAARVDYSADAVERRTEAQARFATGYLHDLNDEPEQAAEDYFNAGLADPANEPLVLEASARLLRFKQHDKALELLKKATAEPNASGTLFAQLGLAYSLDGKKERAIEANQTAIKRLPRSMVGYRNLAQIYLRETQPEEGLKILDQASSQADVDANFLTELGELYLAFAKAGPKDTAKLRALDAFNRAAKENPANPIVIERLADAFVFLGELDAAAALYQKLLESFPGLSGLREKLAELYVRKKDYPKAAEQYQALIRLNPTTPQAYFMLGSIAFEEKKMQEATDHFGKVMQLNPNFEPVYYELAGAQISLNQPTNALATLGKARSRFKPNFVCEFYTALAYSRLKQYTNAIEHLVAAEVVARVNDTNRLNHLFYFQLGAAYERNKQYDEAVANFRKCLQMAPDFSEALNYLGYMWAERGENLTEARDMIEKAVKSEPKNAAFLDSLGWVLFKLGNPQEALPLLLKAVEYAEEPDPTLHDHLGDVYQALGELGKAREAWRKSLTIEPNENKDNIQKKLETSGLPPNTSAGSSPR